MAFSVQKWHVQCKNGTFSENRLFFGEKNYLSSILGFLNVSLEVQKKFFFAHFLNPHVEPVKNWCYNPWNFFWKKNDFFFFLLSLFSPFLWPQWQKNFGSNFFFKKNFFFMDNRGSFFSVRRAWFKYETQKKKSPLFRKKNWGPHFVGAGMGEG